MSKVSELPKRKLAYDYYNVDVPASIGDHSQRFRIAIANVNAKHVPVAAWHLVWVKGDTVRICRERSANTVRHRSPAKSGERSEPRR